VWATYAAGKQAGLAADDHMASSDTGHRLASVHCLARRPCRQGEPGIDRWEDGPQLVHSLWGEGRADHRCSGKLDLEEADHQADHLERRRVLRVLGRHRPCVRSPPPSFEPSILFEFP
jgi:hypothetical protein